MLIAGGPDRTAGKTGPSGPAEEEVVLGGTGGLLALAREDRDEHPCIRCGGCARCAPPG